jgi:hypothetical protein
MVFKGTIAAYSENHNKPLNTLCEQESEFLYTKAVTYIVTTLLKIVKNRLNFQPNLLMYWGYWRPVKQYASMLTSAGQISGLQDTKNNVQSTKKYQPDVSTGGIFKLIFKIALYNYQLFGHYLHCILGPSNGNISIIIHNQVQGSRRKWAYQNTLVKCRMLDEWRNRKDLEGCSRGLIGIISRHLPYGTEENHWKSQPG